jgi:hypothetical protein
VHAPIFALTLIVYHTVAGYDHRSEMSDCSADGRKGAPLRQKIQENFDKRDKKAQITFPLRYSFPLKVVKSHGKVKSKSMENCPA